jgi:hypothetical protein
VIFIEIVHVLLILEALKVNCPDTKTILNINKIPEAKVT